MGRMGICFFVWNEQRANCAVAVYDLSRGMAKQYLSGLLGISVEAIYHTGVRVYGYEYFYSDGIQKMRPDEVFPLKQFVMVVGGDPIRYAAD